MFRRPSAPECRDHTRQEGESRERKTKKKRPFLPPAQTKKVRARSEPLPATRQSALRSEDDSFSLLPTNSLEDRGGAGSSAAGSVVSQVRVPSAARFPSSAVHSPSLVCFPTREPLTLRPLLMVGSILPLLPAAGRCRRRQRGGCQARCSGRPCPRHKAARYASLARASAPPRPNMKQTPQSRSATPPPLVPVTPWNGRPWLALILLAKP